MYTVLSELLLLFGKIRSSDDTNIDLRLKLVQKLHHFRRSCLGCENDAKNLYLSTLGESSINIEERNNFLGSRSHGFKNLSLSGKRGINGSRPYNQIRPNYINH